MVSKHAVFKGWQDVGVTVATFHSSGNDDFTILTLKMSANGEAIPGADILKMLLVMRSAPRALFGFRSRSSSVQTAALVTSRLKVDRLED